jgi:hypothetical protein
MLNDRKQKFRVERIRSGDGHDCEKRVGMGQGCSMRKEVHALS